ncbi:gluconate 2-dehydrogenase subunit 3 family protein [Paucibacter sp. R3-3]|uniref:Gluconate 2-dehydrogenase subunit 3 family protein n=1 Tax=Roseateles agri TaxID=3098619 RepID=A0ABU5DAD5_9BURK|nr:gluconate 2-dehydrogenase subunit 3 family protein [Paucibacter sp. R3-3]MDY0743188.1 gluconate 2-dehydrogenase subunit 3 family protein [Paucibacter sp. R3-3]
MDRRTTLQWMLAASAALGVPVSAGATPATRKGAKPTGYGTDPKLTQSYKSGELWPLTFNAAQNRTAQALCGLIIPADAQSPSAAQLQVHRFIDEWVSAPYPDQAQDRPVIIDGLAWLEAESAKRFGGKRFDQLDVAQQSQIADDICWTETAKPEFAAAAKFFQRFRDLTAGGFYTTPEGMKDVGFVGNTPSVTFDGPPLKVLQIVGVA